MESQIPNNSRFLWWIIPFISLVYHSLIELVIAFLMNYYLPKFHWQILPMLLKVVFLTIYMCSVLWFSMPKIYFTFCFRVCILLFILLINTYLWFEETLFNFSNLFIRAHKEFIMCYLYCYFVFIILFWKKALISKHLTNLYDYSIFFFKSLSKNMY